MQTNKKIDWLTLTKPWDLTTTATPTGQRTADLIAFRMMSESQLMDATGAQQIKRNEPHYQYHYQMQNGAVLSLSEQQLQGVRLVFNGQSMPVGEAEQIRLWKAIHDEQWRKTRVDFAIDFFDSDTSIQQCWDDGLYAQAQNRRFKSDFILSPNGDTINIGARTSEKFLRIYDKGSEQKTSLDWKRIEIEVKGKTARHLPEPYTMAFRRAIASINTMASVLPDEWKWTLAEMQAGARGLTKESPRTQGNKELWLMMQVIPALKKVYQNDPSLYHRFLSEALSISNPAVSTDNQDQERRIE